MKIAVISAARTRSTVLSSFIFKKYPHLKRVGPHLFGEFYTNRIFSPTSVDDLTNELFSHDDFFVKLLGQNVSIMQRPQLHFVGKENIKPERLRLKEYDELYLIERHDYFRQVCSYHVAFQTRVWNQHKTAPVNEYAEIRNRKFNFDINQISYLTADIAGYLEIKKYLKTNSIPFSLHVAEKDITQEVSSGSEVVPSEFDYASMIHGYYEFSNILNEVFYKYFNYETCEYDYEGYMQALADLLKMPVTK